ncbi:MAG: glycosyltransferase family 39 protein, partial [Candidatus Limnocylindrales bacterium]
PARATPAARAGRATVVVAASVGLGIVALALARVAAGWSPLAPDDARYLFVGLSVLDGQGAITPSGDPYLLRSPVYGVALALGSRLLGGDPLNGARVVAVLAALLGLLGATRVAWLVAGPGAALGAAVALAATPIIWQLVPSLRIDLPQTALVLGLLLAAWRPTVPRWIVAGVVLGLVILVKETALPLVLLPLVLLGSVPRAVVRRLAVAYVAAAVATAGWWWVVVFVASGQVFPANALAVIEGRDVSGSLRLATSALPLAAAAVVGWTVIARRARHELGSRLLLGTAVGLAPAAIYAAGQGLNARNFAAVAVLSTIAVGIAGATLVAAARARARTGAGQGRSMPLARATTLMTMVAVVAFTILGPVIGQTSVVRPGSDRLTDQVVAWVDDHVPDRGRIAMFFRDREALALRRFDRTEVALVGVRRMTTDDEPSAYLWIGLRDAQLFGYTRGTWTAVLADGAPAALVMVGPHPFTPTELVGSAPDAAAIPGLTPIATLEAGSDRAEILRVDPTQVRRGTDMVALHLSADAALAWLDFAAGPGGDDDAVARLLAARPVVSGPAIATLLERLGTRACAVPGSAGTMVLTPAPTCPA